MKKLILLSILSLYSFNVLADNEYRILEDGKCYSVEKNLFSITPITVVKKELCIKKIFVKYFRDSLGYCYASNIHDSYSISNIPCDKLDKE
jgi:hypothetical protein